MGVSPGCERFLQRRRLSAENGDDGLGGSAARELTYLVISFGLRSVPFTVSEIQGTKLQRELRRRGIGQHHH